MSLNKTLDRLFDEIRREAKRNPDFADRLDAVLRLHGSRRDVSEDALADVATAEGGAPPQSAITAPAPSPRRADTQTKPAAPPALNPAGLYKRAGEDALTEALAALDLAALRALVVEHNLDPGGVTGAMPQDELAAHIIAQAKRRAERDDKMFDY